MPEGERPQECSDGRGCIHTTEEGLHPARTHYVEIIDAVHAGTHAGDNLVSFGDGLAHPDLILGAGMQILSANDCANPVWAASVITGTNPAHDTAWRHLPVAPALDDGGVVAADRDHRLYAGRRAQRPGQSGGTSRRSTVRVSSRPSRRLAAAPGWVRSVPEPGPAAPPRPPAPWPQGRDRHPAADS